MTQRADSLAQRFETANNEFITLIERLDEGQWKTRCAAEGWTVGVAASHIADDHTLLADFVQMVANGKSLPDVTVEQVDQMNAEQVQRNASRAKAEVVELLRTNGAAAAGIIRALTDSQLDTATTLAESHPIRVLDDLPERVTPQDLIEAVMIRHFDEHGGSIQATVAARAAAR